MAGVEQSTAPGASTPDETPEAAETRAARRADHTADQGSSGTSGETLTRAGRRAARRRASQEAGQKADAGEPLREPIQHAPDSKRAQHAADPADAAKGPRVSLIKAARPAHSDAAPSGPGQELVLARTPRPSGPAHSNAPIYRPRHAKRRRRWPVLLAAGLVLVALAAVGAAALLKQQNDETDRAAPPAATNYAPAPANRATDGSGAPSVAPTPGADGVPGAAGAPALATAECRYNAASDKTPRFLPTTRATRAGLVKATIGTSRGPVTLELDATDAPCTVESFLTLAANGYYNDTACHRLTTMVIFVLQCGDPTALGSGDPGYSFDDENLPAPGGTPYPRGTLAMANAGPDTNGSQFFIVSGRSGVGLPPQYSLFGKVVTGLEVIEKMEKVPTGSGDRPVDDVVINSVTITETEPQ
jgi:cyclophilin family peptidyl-prolyl cis-trans isomerase